MKRGLILFGILFIYSLNFGATVSGNTIDISTYSGVDGITIYLQRTYPNPWENLTYTSESDEYGYFEMNEVLTGQYRIYTNWNDEYFAGYYEDYIDINSFDEYVGNIVVDMQPVLTTRGSISGSLIPSAISLDNTFFGIQLKHYVAPDDMEITMGFIELDEDGYFLKDDLNIGNYKIGLLFYGEFNGELWYDAVLGEEDATILQISAENPEITGIDFNFTHHSLNSSYVAIEEVIIDYGWDGQLDFGETVEFSLNLKNIGSQPAVDNTFAIMNYFESIIEMEHIYQQIEYLAPGEELVVGPFEFTVAADVADGSQFNLWYLYYGQSNTIQTPIPFLVNAPVLEFVEYTITSNEGDIVLGEINYASALISNIGNSPINYPIVAIISQDEEVILESDFYTNYYWIGAEDGYLDFYFEFMIDEDNLDDYQLDFTLIISSLDGIYEDEIPFNMDLILPTDSPDENIISNNGLLNNYPNPFNPTTTISFQLENTQNSSLTIYDAMGRKVKSYNEQDFNMNNGNFEVYWNGRDDKGKSVASGIYLYKLKNSRYTATKKMILLK